MIIITIPPSGFWLCLCWIWVHDNSSSFPLDSGAACPSPPPPGPRSPPPPPWCWSLASSQSWRRSRPPATTHWCQKTKMAGTENIGHYYIYLRQYSPNAAHQKHSTTWENKYHEKLSSYNPSTSNPLHYPESFMKLFQQFQQSSTLILDSFNMARVLSRFN